MTDNTLRPDLVWIGERCYRFGESGVWSADRGKAAYQEESMYTGNDCCSDEDSANDEIEMQQIGGGKFMHSFRVAKPFFPFLIGAKGSTRKRLETETSTTIHIPKLGQNGNVVVVGSNRKKIILARNRLDDLIKTSRKKLYVTHMISIPANSENIQNGFQEFKKSVLEMSEPIQGVDESIFQNPKKMHITIGVMVLLDDEEKQNAIEALEYCKENIIASIIRDREPISITLQGVDYMNDEPARINVLYAKVHSNDSILQEIVDKISQYFLERDIIKKDEGKVKLHATLMNTKFKYKHDDRRGSKKETFDATKILKVITGEHDLGEQLLDHFDRACIKIQNLVNSYWTPFTYLSFKPPPVPDTTNRLEKFLCEVATAIIRIKRTTKELISSESLFKCIA